jgi:putative flippase GtrA
MTGTVTARATTTATVNSYGNEAPTSKLVRWCKFNFVGGIGIGVQFAALFLLKSVLHFDYLAATAIAVEAAVVHNFVWHEQFTWADRTKLDRVQASWRAAAPHPSEAEPSDEKRGFGWRGFGWSGLGWQGFGYRSAFSAAIKSVLSIRALAPAVLRSRYGPSFRRLLRFNLTNGAVSILGNLALMKVMVGQGHMNYLLANAIAIASCSLANFLVSDEWVFGERA